jgi:hypothetical protein
MLYDEIIGRGYMKKLLLMILLLTLTYGCTAEDNTAISNESIKKTLPVSESISDIENEEQLRTATEINKEKETITDRIEVYINEQVQLVDMVIVLNEFSDEQGVGYSVPSVGNKFVSCDLTFYNVGSEDYLVSSNHMFELTDSEGNAYYASFMAQTKSRLSSMILPGRMVRGKVLFEVPKESIATELLYDYSWIVPGQVVFILDNEQSVDVTLFDNPVKEPVKYKIGDTIESSDFDIVVKSISESLGSDYKVPLKGYKYLVLDMKVKNNKLKKVDVMSLRLFKLQDEQGYIHSVNSFTGSKESIDRGLDARGTKEGVITFEVPEDQSDFDLLFMHGPHYNELVIIELN